MSYSVRFYLDAKKAPKELNEVTNSVRNLGKFVESPGENYYEFKVEHHLMAHPDEFIPVQFQQMIRPFLSRVTMVTKNYGRYGIKDGDTRVPTLVGSNMISLEQYEVMVVGRSLRLIVKAYMLFCKYNGEIPNYEKQSSQQKEEELHKKYTDSLGKYLEKKSKAVPTLVSRKKKPSWKFW